MKKRCNKCGAELITKTITEPCRDSYCQNGDWYGMSYNDPNPSECPTCKDTGKSTEKRVIIKCPNCDED